MKSQNVKKIISILPLFIKKGLLMLYENYTTWKMLRTLGYTNKQAFKKITEKIRYTDTKNRKINILVYKLSGLTFGGTEKFLQVIAKYLSKEKFNVHLMYSEKAMGGQKNDGRKYYLEESISSFIDCTYTSIDGFYPYTVRDLKPDINSVLEQNKIDLIITAGSGYSEFPINMIRNTPIIMVNIFGSPSAQRNIVKNICISNEVSEKVSKMVGPEKNKVSYILSERPALESDKNGLEIRKRFSINDDEFVFGRIGRPDDGIFDPIGINAFKGIIKDYPKVHYIIMSPPPILRKIVDHEKIPNVHFLDPSPHEKDIWAFHKSIDALAHFRLDGESFGLNIAESMLSGKPIITHKSAIWNAHLEYLLPSFSRIAEKDSVDQYYIFMKEMIEKKKSGEIIKMGIESKQQADNLFLAENNIKNIEEWIEESIHTKNIG